MALVEPDGVLRADASAILDLGQYRTVVLPECHALTEPQARALARFLDGGGRVVAVGAPGVNLDDDRRQALTEHPGLSLVDAVTVEALAGGAQIAWDGDADVAVNIVPVARGAAIHIIRYDHDDEVDATPILHTLELTVRLDDRYDSVASFSPGGELAATMTRDGDRYRLRLERVPLYGIVLLGASPPEAAHG